MPVGGGGGGSAGGGGGGGSGWAMATALMVSVAASNGIESQVGDAVERCGIVSSWGERARVRSESVTA